MIEKQRIITNYKADGSVGGGVSFAIVGDHENRPTDMTNILVFSVHEASGQDVTIQEELAYSLVTGGGKPGHGFPCIMELYDDRTDSVGNNSSTRNDNR